MSTASSTEVKEGELTPSRLRLDWRILVSVLAILLAVLISVFWGARQKAQEGFYGFRLFPLKDAYNFNLIDQDGQPFQLSKLNGKVALFTFGFTHCPNICPTTLMDLATVYKALPAADRNRVQILFISVDPRRDKPEVLKNYIPYFDPGIVGLTGSKDAIDQAVNAYGASYEINHQPGDDPQVYSVNHSAFTYLVNPERKLEVLYDYEKLTDTKRIVSDIEKVLKERGG
ncbi:MAG: SCO family protein [Chthoniobacterales bacterium]